MKIVFVINTLSSGGAERVASRLSSEWSKNNDVFLVKTSFFPTNHYKVSKNVKIIDLCKKKIVNKILIVTKLRKLLKTIKPDVVLSFLDTGHFYVSLAKIGLNMTHICSERNDPRKSPKKLLFRVMRAFSFKRCNGVVFQTREAMNYFPKSIINKSIIIPNPIDDKKTASNHLGKLNFNMVAVGRLEQQKNYFFMIDCIKKLTSVFPLVKLSIFGSGSLKKELETYTLKIGAENHVFFRGFIDKIEQEYSKNDIFVMTSLHEGFPNSLLEAVSSGLPAVAIDFENGGSKEILEGLHGSLLVDKYDVDLFCGAIAKIFNNYDYYILKAKDDAVLIERRYNINEVSSRWLDFFVRVKNS